MKSVDQVVPMLERGRKLLHCLHGVHRTGMLIGAWQARRGWPQAEIRFYNKLDDFPNTDTGRRYVETALAQARE